MPELLFGSRKWKVELSTRSWKHAFVWVNDDVPVWARGSELRDEGCYTDAGIFLLAGPEGREILQRLLEQSGNGPLFEVVL